MSKTYKGYELYKMIAEGKIAKGTKFKEDGDIIEFNGCNFVFAESKSALAYRYDDISIAQMDFELLEDEIDIKSIEEYPKILHIGKSEENIKKVLNDIIDNQNELLEAVKQLDRSKEDKQ